MGLSKRLSALASSRLHILVVECPGAFPVRAAVEHSVLGRGWRLADSPADADALVVCGTSVAPVMLEAIETVWEQLPGPRSRVGVGDVAGAAGALNRLAADWRDPARRLDDTRQRIIMVVADSEQTMDHGQLGHGQMGHGEMDHGQMGHGEMDHGQLGHGQMDHGQMDHGEMGHSEMDHAMMMSGPGGIPLASGGLDRDGLEMDVVSLRLGPVLTDWPAGLVVWCRLQGDAVTEVDAEVLEVPGVAGGVSLSAYRVDAAARILSLAGAIDLAAQARHLCTRLLDHDTSDQVLGEFATVRRKVGRSRLLRWSLRGLAEVDNSRGQFLDCSRGWWGDAHQRLLDLLDLDTAHSQPAELTPFLAEADLRGIAEALPQLLPGTDLAAARLIVASLVGHGDQLVEAGNDDNRRAGV